MNVLFLTLLDFSDLREKGIYTDLMKEFVDNNHNVYIISPIEKRKNVATNIIKKDNYQILKLQIGNVQKTNMVEKGISTLLLENQFVKGIKQYFSNVKFDLVIYSTPPITLRKAVDFVKRRDNAVSYLLLKDIFPQNAVDLGIITKKGIKKLIYSYFRYKEINLYKISDYIGCMSQANVEFLTKNNKGIIENKVIEICPNTITPSQPIKNDKNRIRKKYEIPTNKTVFIYGGNLGKPQGIDFLIDCINSNKNNEKVYFVIVGSGTEYQKLRDFLNKNKLTNIKLISQLPKTEYELLASSCDVGLIFLDYRFSIPNFPSRILSYMQASMPILAATDTSTDVGKIIEEGNFGYWCCSNNVKSFTEKIELLCDKEIVTRMGNNSRLFLEKNYTSKHSYKIIMKHFN
ncbi:MULTISPECIES: glycosyltransferase family 4 protein [Lysinibacillus]|uniref:glycosyltransferase family 4 protein n=1 Tax=Lysinibacillus TaxID=400634 RepID=UPI00214C56CC|nr:MULTISPECIES: glycosyltransferase family 4 protein [Lysinibacillus]UUV25088.1 glycosyltransferase family 4 protein [Lysinibacillus sp. FN11]UYB47960.1 glycosyltransferase family 4 protein [Lysinibacillus capsici]